MKPTLVLIASLLVMPFAGFAQDPGWPREMTKDGARLVYYQPQVDTWKDFKELDFRLAVSLTPPGTKAAIGVVVIHARTDTNVESRTVLIHDLAIQETRFPALAPDAAASMDRLVRTFLAPTHSVVMSMDRLIATVEKSDPVPTVELNNDPPVIVVSYSPAIVLQVDGDPILVTIPDTDMQFVVNTSWPLFLDQPQARYYLFTGTAWLTSSALDGPWSATTTLPKGMSKLRADPQWEGLKNAIPPPPAGKAAVPQVFYSNRPAEIILFRGQPVYASIPGTQLVYATNTDSDVFVHTAKGEFYYLAAGRWFRASDLQGPWSFATPDLPADFALIPPESPAARVRISVPGTDEAKDAVLLALIPTTVEVDPIAAAAQVDVTYSGEPEFKPIETTSLSYATNTPDKVIQVGDVYYLCLQGVWFMSTTPKGPWKTAESVPKEIYSIPPSSPVYNVTYVTQTTTPTGSVQSSYTAGYVGAFVLGAVVGAVIANGSGHYCQPYVYYPPHGYPVYRPYPVPYGAGAYHNPYTGAYGRSVTAYGPYGSATAGKAYNPYTGTYARGATTSNAYGSRSAAQAYNPYTGAAAATRQGSSPYAQWGSSVVSSGDQAVVGRHVTTGQGSYGTVQGSQGGSAVAASGSRGSGYAGKTAGGDMYVGKDGNVYKNTGGSWQKYDDGNWNTMSPPAGAQQPAKASQQSASTSKAGQQPPSGAAPAAQAQGGQKPGTHTSSTHASSASAQGMHPPASKGGSGASRHATTQGAPAQRAQVEHLDRERQNRQRGSAQAQQFERTGARQSGGGGSSRSSGGGRRR